MDFVEIKFCIPDSVATRNCIRLPLQLMNDSWENVLSLGEKGNTRNGFKEQAL